MEARLEVVIALHKEEPHVKPSIINYHKRTKVDEDPQSFMWIKEDEMLDLKKILQHNYL